MIISFLRGFFFVAVVITPLLAVIGFFVCLCSKNLRRGLVPAFIGATIGYGINFFILFGRAKISEMGWAVLVIVPLAIIIVSEGFLIGLGTYCLFAKGRKFLGIYTTIAILLFPLALFGFVYIRPKLIANNLAWWQVAFKNGATSEMEKEAASHFDSETKLQLGNGMRYAAPGSIPPSTIALLYHNGLLGGDYVPMPPDIAREMTSGSPPYDLALARNPSIPPDVMEKMSESNDFGFLCQLGYNSSLPNDVAEKLFSKCEATISNENAKSEKDRANWDINGAKGGLVSLAKNPGMPPDVLEKLSGSDDVNLLRELVENPALPASTAESLRQKFEAMLTSTQSPLPNSQSVSPADFGKYALRILASNRGIGAGVMEKLSDSDDLELLQHLASNPALPESVAEKLITKFNAIISAPKKQLSQFQIDEEYAGLATLAENTHLPTNILDELSVYDNAGLLRRLAENPSLSDQTAQTLQLKLQKIGAIANNAPESSDRVGILDEVRMGLDALAKRNK
jgi:hypothetical protein